MNHERTNDLEEELGDTDVDDVATADGELEAVSRVGPVTVDELFDVLSRPANRYVLTYLLLEDGPVSLVDLVEYVIDAIELPEDTKRAEFSGQLLNRFIETTLPELDDRGLIEYDRTSQMVEESEATALTLPYLRAGLQQSAADPSERDT